MVVLIQDIVDRKSLTAWLKALPFDAAQNRQIAVALAARAALRAFILAWDPTGSGGPVQKYPSQDQTVRILRALLMSNVAVNMSTLAIAKAAAAALAASQSASAAVAVSAGGWDAVQADWRALKSGSKATFFAPLLQGGEYPSTNH